MARTKKEFDKDALYKKLMPTPMSMPSKNSPLYTPEAIPTQQPATQMPSMQMPSVKKQAPPSPPILQAPPEKKTTDNPLQFRTGKPPQPKPPSLPPKAPALAPKSPLVNPMTISKHGQRKEVSPAQPTLSQEGTPPKRVPPPRTTPPPAPVQEADAFCEKIPIVIQKFEEVELQEGIVPNVDWINSEFATTRRIYKENPVPKAAEIAFQKWNAPDLVPQNSQQPPTAFLPQQFHDATVPEDRMQRFYEQESSFLTAEEDMFHPISTQPTYEEDIMSEMNFVYPVEEFVERSHCEPGKVLVHNAMEDLVMHCIHVNAQGYVACMCEQCLSDIAALALNELPTKYVAAPKEEIVQKTLQFVNSTEIDVSVQVVKAILRVKESPRH